MINKPFITVTDEGLLVVSDPENFRLIVFNTAGDYQYSFGNSSNHTVGIPLGLAYTNGGIWVSDDLGNRLIFYNL